MGQPTSAIRRAWLTWHFAHGENVTQTARHFGISRATLYRWLTRYDPARPDKPLRSRSRRPHHFQGHHWTDEEFIALSHLAAYNPRWGRGRLRLALGEKIGDMRSEATIGRMLQLIARRCPACKATDHRHSVSAHLLAQDLASWGHVPPIPRYSRRQPTVDPEVAAVIREAQQIRSRSRE